MMANVTTKRAPKTDLTSILPHLEYFWRTTKYSSLAETVRSTRGLSRSKLNYHLNAFEKFLDRKLYLSRMPPLKLTEEGECLEKFLSRFLGELELVTEEISGNAGPAIRIGANAVVLQSYLPAVLQEMFKADPNFRVVLKDGWQQSLERDLREGELDVVITLLVHKRNDPGIEAEKLLDLELVLLVSETQGITRLEQLWKKRQLIGPLVSLPATDPMCEIFRNGMKKRGIVVPIGWRVPNLQLVEAYVACSGGIGLSVDFAVNQSPEQRESLKNRKIGVLRLPKNSFPPVELGVLYRAKSSDKKIHELIERFRKKAEDLEEKRKVEGRYNGRA